MPSFENPRSISSRRIAQHGQQFKQKSKLPRNGKNTSFVGGIEILFAEIDAIFGKKKKQSSKLINHSYLRKNHSPFLTDDLSDEFDLWFLRVHATLESVRDTISEIYKNFQRKILNYSLRIKFLLNKDIKVYPNDNIQALTEEIEEIFGGRLRRFGARVNLQKVVSQKSCFSANDLRNELERLLKKDKNQFIMKDVA